MMNEVKDKIAEKIIHLSGVNGVGVVLREGQEMIEISVSDETVKSEVQQIIQDNDLDKYPILILERDKPKLQ